MGLYVSTKRWIVSSVPDEHKRPHSLLLSHESGHTNFSAGEKFPDSAQKGPAGGRTHRLVFHLKQSFISRKKVGTFSKSRASGQLLAIPPTSLEGLKVSYPLQPDGLAVGPIDEVWLSCSGYSLLGFQGVAMAAGVTMDGTSHPLSSLCKVQPKSLW